MSSEVRRRLAGTARRNGRWRATNVVRRLAADAGMTTAEYAVGTVAACGFGGILYKILTSPEVMKMLKDLIEKALGLAF